MFKKLFGRAAPEPKAEAKANKPPIPTEFDALKTVAFNYTRALIDVHIGVWHMDEAQSADIDLAEGRITWIFPEKRVTAPCQLISSWNEADGTYQWGWDHPSAPEGTALAAAAVKAHADLHGIAELQANKIPCSMEDGWSLSAIAVLLTDLEGVYRYKASETAWVYLGFGSVTMSKD